MDFVATLHDILNLHLGLDNEGGGRRLPDSFDPLKHDLCTLLRRVHDVAQEKATGRERERVKKALGI